MTQLVCFTWDGTQRIDFFHSTEKITPDFQYKAHTHNCCEFYLFVKGPETDYVVEGNRFRIQPGDIVLTREQELHCPIFYGEGDYECFYMKLTNDCFDRLSHRMQSPLYCFRERDRGCDNLLRMTEEEQRLVMRTCYQILQEKDFPHETSRTFCFSYVLLILATINRAFARNAALPADSVLSPLMQSILGYVNNNIAQIHDAQEVAGKFFITTSYFSRLFRNNMNITFTKYLRSKKIALAKKHLIQGSTVTEACFESGFEDYSYFISTFHREVGVSPLQYQKKVQNKSE